MQTKKLILMTILITLALIHNVIAENGNLKSNVSESEINDSHINATETEYTNDTKDEGTITDKLNISAPESVDVGKEYKIKVTDKQGNPAANVKLDIFIGEELITTTTDKEGIAKITPNTTGKIDGIFAFSIPVGKEPIETNEPIEMNKTHGDNSTKPLTPQEPKPNYNNYLIIAIILITILLSAFVIWYKKFKR